MLRRIRSDHQAAPHWRVGGGDRAVEKAESGGCGDGGVSEATEATERRLDDEEEEERRGQPNGRRWVVAACLRREWSDYVRSKYLVQQYVQSKPTDIDQCGRDPSTQQLDG